METGITNLEFYGVLCGVALLLNTLLIILLTAYIIAKSKFKVIGGLWILFFILIGDFIFVILGGDSNYLGAYAIFSILFLWTGWMLSDGI